MLKRALLLFFVLFTTTLAVFACGGDTTKPQGALVVIITTDLSLDDMNTFRVEVSQEASPGTYGEPLIAKDYAIPAESPLPATLTIASGKAPSQNVLVRVIGRKVDGATNTPVVLREAEVRVPSDRVAALTMILSAACAGQVTTDASGRYVSTCASPHESCQPTTGACGSSIVDVDTLPLYDQVKDRDAALPIVAIDDASTGPIGPHEKEITSFVLAGIPATISGSDIFVSLPPNASQKQLTPTIVYRGAKIEPDPSVPQDFDRNVVYTVSAEDGTERVYTVHTTLAAPSSKSIDAFIVAGAITYYPTEGSTVDEIELDFPYGADITHVTPTIIFTGKSVDPPSLQPVDLTNPVNYTVTAHDGSTRVYRVIAEVADATTAEIKSFKINGSEGQIFDAIGDIDVTLDNGGDVTNLTPEIELIGKSIDPPKGAAKDFTNPVTYTVTAGDGVTTKKYEVTVTRPPVSVVTFSPLGGSYGHAIDVKLSCKTPGAEIHYTIGAGDPTKSDPLYSAAAPISFPSNPPQIAKFVRARCFSSKFDPQQQASQQSYNVGNGGTQFDAPEEIVFGPTKCGETAAAKTFAINNLGSPAAFTVTSPTPSSFTVTPSSTTAATGGTDITAQPKAVPLGTKDDIAEVVTFTFPGGIPRSTTLRQLVTCP